MAPDPRFASEFLPLFQQLIQNACVNTGQADSGFEDRSVETLSDYFRSKGLQPVILRAREGRGNLLIRIPGTQPGAASLMFMSHLDVVPAEKSDWTHPPFAGEEHDGHIWGRGTVDMLCWTAAQAVGFVTALESAPPEGFPGDLVFLAVADEEASGRWGARYLTEQHPDLVRADYMVTELGGFFYETSRGPVAFCTLGEKGVAWAKIAFRGTAGHGSMPYGSDNAVVKASQAILRLSRAQWPTKRSALYQSMASAVAEGWLERITLTTGWCERWALRRLFRRNPGMARFLQTAGSLTISPNVVHGGSKVNIVADRAEVLLDCRVLPGTSPEELEQWVRKALGKTLGQEAAFEVTEWFPSNVSLSDQPLRDAVEEAFREAHPDARLVDFFIGGVTDGRYWRKLGTVVLGFSLFSRSLTIDAYGQRIHGKDERIDLASLQLSVDFFSRLPARFFRHILDRA